MASNVMARIRVSIFLTCVVMPVASSFQIIVDLNTYSASELTYATSHFRANGTWSITVNSPGLADPIWSEALALIGGSGSGNEVFSEDNPGSFAECQRVGRLAPKGHLSGAFVYHETGGVPATMLNAAEIDAAAAACGGAQVIILTRTYGPSPWRTNVQAVLNHSNLLGVAMEFNPNDYGTRDEGEFVKEVLAAGKVPFFLLPFVVTQEKTEDVIKDALDNFAAQGADMKDPRVHVVLARYNTPHVPIAGPSNTIEAALVRTQRIQATFESSELRLQAATQFV